MSPAEKAQLDAAVEEAKKAEPLMTRNRFLRNFIATLTPKET